MRKRVWVATMLAATLGTACGGMNRRQAAGVYVGEPLVENGVFTRVGRGQQAWVFDPAVPWEKKLRVWVTPETDILVNGTQADVRAVRPGRTVRLVYDLRRDGTGVAERIDVIARETGEAGRDTDI